MCKCEDSKMLDWLIETGFYVVMGNKWYVEDPSKAVMLCKSISTGNSPREAIQAAMEKY